MIAYLSTCRFSSVVTIASWMHAANLCFMGHHSTGLASSGAIRAIPGHYQYTVSVAHLVQVLSWDRIYRRQHWVCVHCLSGTGACCYLCPHWLQLLSRPRSGEEVVTPVLWWALFCRVTRIWTIPEPLLKICGLWKQQARWSFLDWYIATEHRARELYNVSTSPGSTTLPANKGGEAMMYLIPIIDKYANLPNIMLFFLANGIAWHNVCLDNGSWETTTNPQAA